MVPTGQRPGRVEDGPAHLDVDEDDLYVFRFEEPLQGLHEVLRGAGRRMRKVRPLPPSQSQRDRDKETETARGKEKQRDQERKRQRCGERKTETRK